MGEFEGKLLLQNAAGASAPYVTVALQECGRMNILLEAMAKSLDELTKGLNGQLNMSMPMEDLKIALLINQVPGRNPFSTASWEKLAWPSMKSLDTWYIDMIVRCDALRVWQETLKTPFSLWMPGLFNPTAFLTAIKQVTARSKKLALDKMGVETHITTMTEASEATGAPADGALVHGLFIEGARWGEIEDDRHAGEESGTPYAGILSESKPKELLPPMPLIYIKAVIVQDRARSATCGPRRRCTTAPSTSRRSAARPTSSRRRSRRTSPRASGRSRASRSRCSSTRRAAAAAEGARQLGSR